jgi:hypothetical protein
MSQPFIVYDPGDMGWQDEAPPAAYSGESGNWYDQYVTPRLERYQAWVDSLTPEQRKDTAEAVLGLLPGPGNVIAARDAAQNWQEASDKFSSGKPALKPAASAALNAAGAVPIAGTLYKAGEGMAGGLARALRAKGANNRKVFAETGAVFTPAGELVRETSDAGAALHLDRLKAGETRQLGDVLEHPDLYARRPELADSPVYGWGGQWSLGRGAPPIKEAGGAYSVPVSASGAAEESALLAQLIKRLQQNEPGLSQAGRHAVGTNSLQLADTLARVEEMAAKSPGDAAILAYRDLLRSHASDVQEVMSGEMTPLVRGLLRKGRNTPRQAPPDADGLARLTESMLYDRSAGGRIANLVRARAADATGPENPFFLGKYTLPGGKTHTWDAGYPNAAAAARQLPIPPAGINDEGLAEYARNLYNYGGRP